MSETGDETTSPVRPTLRVVRGAPTPQDLAVIAAAISLASRPVDAPAEQPRSWSAFWRQHRTPARPGPGAWRSSAERR